MQEYWSYKGLLLDKHEWAGGYGSNHKQVTKEQSFRRKQIKKGYARTVDESEWM